MQGRASRCRERLLLAFRVLLVLIVLRTVGIFRTGQNVVTLRKLSKDAVTAAATSGREAMKARVRRLLRQRLSTEVVIMMVAILVVTTAAGLAVVQWNLNRQLDDQYEQRSLAVAQSLASQPGLQQAVRTGGPAGIGPHGVVQSMAMAAMRSTSAAFVVVTNAKGIRLSHPNPRLIGTPVWYPDKDLPASEPFRTGQDWMGIEPGTIGMEAVGKAPIFGSGKLIGQVSVGFLTATVAGHVARTLVDLAVYFLGVLALGVLAALGLARRLKRQTFGLELREIAALLQEREAMLHGIREGVLGYDKNERIVLANDFARELLDLLPEFVGRPLRHVLPPGRLADVVTGEIEGSDLLVLHRRPGAGGQPDAHPAGATGTSAGWSRSRTGPSPRR